MEAWSLEKEGLGPRWELAPVDSVRLANNRLDSLRGIPTAIGRFLFMGSPAVLISLDLSFNNIRRLEGRVSRHLWLISTDACILLVRLAKIERRCFWRQVLAALPNLVTLFLHTNAIAEWGQVKKLGALRLLERLSLQVCLPQRLGRFLASLDW